MNWVQRYKILSVWGDGTWLDKIWTQHDVHKHQYEHQYTCEFTRYHTYHRKVSFRKEVFVQKRCFLLFFLQLRKIFSFQMFFNIFDLAQRYGCFDWSYNRIYTQIMYVLHIFHALSSSFFVFVVCMHQSWVIFVVLCHVLLFFFCFSLFFKLQCACTHLQLQLRCGIAIFYYFESISYHKHWWCINGCFRYYWY